MPDKPTLVDFFNLRFAPARHVLQSANYALQTGQPEETVLACLLHDVVQNLIKVDHGWWGAQLVEPYVDERVAWAIRYHAALRFYPDESVGYEYPEMYNRIFGEDYIPEPYIERDYQHARAHKWYMDARLVTLNDHLCIPGWRGRFDRTIYRHHRAPLQATKGRFGIRRHALVSHVADHRKSEQASVGLFSHSSADSLYWLNLAQPISWVDQALYFGVQRCELPTPTTS